MKLFQIFSVFSGSNFCAANLWVYYDNKEPPTFDLRLRRLEKILRPLGSKRHVGAGGDFKELHSGSQTPAAVRDAAQHRRVGGRHLGAPPPRGPGGPSAVLPAGQTVQGAEGRGQVQK